MRRVLLVAMHYPPMYGSGVQRLLALSRDLPEFGWQVDVLTVAEHALPEIEQARTADIPPNTAVIRACGVDTRRSLSFKGRYPTFLALPDRWITWRIGAVLAGLRYVRQQRPDALLSSFPIATAHHIGADLRGLTRVPWVADFRDPMAQDEYPADQRVWQSFLKVEQRVTRGAQALTFTSPSAKDYYVARYGADLASRCAVVPNGYDQVAFAELNDGSAPAPLAGRRIEALHSGLLYPWERNPLPFFRAVAALHQQGFFAQHPMHFMFRASGFTEQFGPAVAALGIAELVSFASRLPYHDALREMRNTDLLLAFQAANSNFQTPAKIYEYLRIGRPILAVVAPGGDTAQLLAGLPIATLADIESEEQITAALRSCVATIESGQSASLGAGASVEQYSRRESARLMAAVLDSVVS